MGIAFEAIEEECNGADVVDRRDTEVPDVLGRKFRTSRCNGGSGCSFLGLVI